MHPHAALKNLNVKKWNPDGRARRFQIGQRERKTRRDEALTQIRNYSLKAADPLATLFFLHERVLANVTRPLLEVIQDSHLAQAVLEDLQLISAALLGTVDGSIASDDEKRRSAAEMLVAGGVPRALELWMDASSTLGGAVDSFLISVTDSAIAAALALDSAVSPMQQCGLWSHNDLFGAVFVAITRICPSHDGASALRCCLCDRIAAELALAHQATIPFLMWLVHNRRHSEFFMLCATLCRKDLPGLDQLIVEAGGALAALLPIGTLSSDDKYYAVRALRDGAESSLYWELVRSVLTFDVLLALIGDADDAVANCVMDILACYPMIDGLDAFQESIQRNCECAGRRLAAIECLTSIPRLAVSTSDFQRRAEDVFLCRAIRPLLLAHETPHSLWIAAVKLLVSICVEGFTGHVRAVCSYLMLSPTLHDEDPEAQTWLEALQWCLNPAAVDCSSTAKGGAVSPDGLEDEWCEAEEPS